MKENAASIDDMVDTCALDVAERGEHTLQEVGDTLALTRERVRVIEARALVKLVDKTKHLHGELGEETRPSDPVLNLLDRL